MLLKKVPRPAGHCCATSTRRVAKQPCVQAAALKVQAPGKRFTTPNVSYSTSKADIDVSELRRLYRTVNSASKVSGSPIKQSFFQHWQHLSDSEADAKLQLLLDKSVAVVAAFSRDSHLYDDDNGSCEPSTSGRAADSEAAGGAFEAAAPLWARWQWRKPRRLVGFVRAAGDAALVATIHDLLIHPNLQGYGLGSVLLRRVVDQVSRAGVYDVGLVAPSDLQSFFRSCAFDLDREESVPMALRQQWWKEVDEINAQLQGNPALQKLLHTAMDDEQRHLFTRWSRDSHGSTPSSSNGSTPSSSSNSSNSIIGAPADGRI